jgi:hypothetical protein
MESYKDRICQKTANWNFIAPVARKGLDLDMASRPTQNRKRPEEESKCGAASQTRWRRGGNDEGLAKKAKAASKKPPAATDLKAAPRAAS